MDLYIPSLPSPPFLPFPSPSFLFSSCTLIFFILHPPFSLYLFLLYSISFFLYLFLLTLFITLFLTILSLRHFLTSSSSSLFYFLFHHLPYFFSSFLCTGASATTSRTRRMLGGRRNQRFNGKGKGENMERREVETSVTLAGA